MGSLWAHGANGSINGLAALYVATHGAQWTNNTGWFVGEPCQAEWYGVQCNGDAVVQLHLNHNNLVGTIPDDICRLDSLEHLYVSQNHVSGTIPQALCNITPLTEFYSTFNFLSGTLPSSCSDLLHNVKKLYLTENAISGTIPLELGGNPALTKLYLDFNQLSGHLPVDLIGASPMLEKLVVEGNRLSGTISSGFGRLPAIVHAFFDFNRFSGSLPSQIGLVRSLTALSLRDLQLSGTIPTQLGDMSRLGQLFIRQSQISGSIPTELGRPQTLLQLALAEVRLSGSIPSELGKLTQLMDFQLYGNSLSGTLPDGLSTIGAADMQVCFLTRHQCCALAECRCISPHSNKFACPLPALRSVCANNLLGEGTGACDVEPSPPPPPARPPQPPKPNMQAFERTALILSAIAGAILLLGVCVGCYYRRQIRSHRALSLLRNQTELQDVALRHALVDEELVHSLWSPQPNSDPTLSVDPPAGGILSRFATEPTALITGQPQDAARGINFYLKAGDAEIYERLVHGVASVQREFADGGTAEDLECLEYVLHCAAGSSSKCFANGTRDRGRNGERLRDFVEHSNSRASGLTEAHVLALRLYTSAAFKSINTPLRDRARTAPHPFPVTVNLIAEGLKRLRTVAAAHEGAHTPKDLWRGMRNVTTTSDFIQEGGTEIAPMSATADLRVALQYGASAHSLLFKISTKSFMERGVDLSYLSCFPEEAEHLFAPLTYLRPTGATQVLCVGDGRQLTVIEVEPTFGT